MTSRRTAFVAIILLLDVIGTAIGWWVTSETEKLSHRQSFDLAADRSRLAISKRMLDHELILRAGAGLWYASNQVDRDEWRRFVETLNLPQNFPGIQGMGFSLWIPSDELARVTESIRAGGFPDFKVTPPGAREAYTSIIYIEPFIARNLRAFGYDMYSEPVRRTAMKRAMESGRPSLSGRVTLKQETETNVQHGVLLYVPVFRGASGGSSPRFGSIVSSNATEEIFGFVYSPYRMNDLMAGILGHSAGDLDLEIYDGDWMDFSTLLYTSNGRPESLGERRPLFERVERMEIYGRTWTLRYASTPSFDAAADRTQSSLVLGVGLAVTALLLLHILSERREAERTETLVIERTSELARAKAELDRRVVELERFAYVASHDLQEPLRAVVNCCGLLKRRLKDGLDEQSGQYLRLAVDGSERMQEIIRDLLEYSRVQNTIELLPVSIRLPLDKALDNLRATIEETKASVVIGEMPVVPADSRQIMSLFQNLVGNALKFRGDLTPEIRITSERSGPFWLFQVIDNGIGIDPKEAGRIFEPFQRLHSRKNFPGTGIGLAMAKKIVENHGGRIWVESSPGKGATFLFTIAAALPPS